MRKRLEELNWRTQPGSLNHEDHAEGVEVLDSKPGEFAASLPMSLETKQQKKKKIA
jgi:hypothetical protein